MFYTFHLLRIVQNYWFSNSVAFRRRIHRCLSNGQNIIVPLADIKPGYVHRPLCEQLRMFLMVPGGERRGKDI